MPEIGDSRPAPTQGSSARADKPDNKQSDSANKPNQKQNSTDKSDQGKSEGGESASSKRRRRRKRKSSDGGSGSNQDSPKSGSTNKHGSSEPGSNKQRSNKQSSNERTSNRQGSSRPVAQVVGDAVELDEEQLKARRGRTRKGRAVGRYLMVVSKRSDATHIAVLEGRNLIEYYVSRPADDVSQIHGNIYLAKVQNVLPGMEAAFVDIGTPKNAVIYRSDVQFDQKDFDNGVKQPKIEQMIKAKQTMICQVTKNPIAHKGARLTQEVSLPGRFVVLVPNSDTYGISKRLPDPERKRLRKILDRVKPKGHGIIVRTAAENVTDEEIERDVLGLVKQWTDIESLAANSKAPTMLYREPEMSVRVIREEFNKEYRGIVIDDQELYDDVADYVGIVAPALAERVELYDSTAEKMSAFERYHVHEQLHRALDHKVWLPSGGSLIIEHTEALTVIDVNTGKNVGKSSLEETVYHNNVEAAIEVAKQLRLRDIGGIIVIDFVDMEDKKHREEVMRTFRQALSRDKTRTQVFDISDLGLAEMTRKRIGEGLLESLSSHCPHCEGSGHILDNEILMD